MAKILLTTAARDPTGDEAARRQLNRLHGFAEQDRFREHFLTEDPGEADVILFAEHLEAGPYFEDVRRHPYVKAHQRKCFLYSAVDKPIPFLPGVYPSIEKRWFRDTWVRSGHYLGIMEKESLCFDPGADPQPYLYSFLGSMKTATRRATSPMVTRLTTTVRLMKRLLCATNWGILNTGATPAFFD